MAKTTFDELMSIGVSERALGAARKRDRSKPVWTDQLSRFCSGFFADAVMLKPVVNEGDGWLR